MITSARRPASEDDSQRDEERRQPLHVCTLPGLILEGSLVEPDSGRLRPPHHKEAFERDVTELAARKSVGRQRPCVDALMPGGNGRLELLEIVLDAGAERGRQFGEPFQPLADRRLLHL
jgi:hypothetical protein